MNNKEKIDSWKWRIYKANYTITSFCRFANVKQSQLSSYINNKKTPLGTTVDKIEKVLEELGV
jgi:hypothetical protein